MIRFKLGNLEINRPCKSLGAAKRVKARLIAEFGIPTHCIWFDQTGHGRLI